MVKVSAGIDTMAISGTLALGAGSLLELAKVLSGS
jgi:hypothetical protein